MSVILNVALVGASILSLASTGGSALGLACLNFSKNCLKVLMEPQFQDFSQSLYLLAQCFHHPLDFHLMLFSVLLLLYLKDSELL